MSNLGEYTYITKDNRIDRQHYMYSAYEGYDFLEKYMFSRHKALNQLNANSGGLEESSSSALLFFLEQLSQQSSCITVKNCHYTIDEGIIVDYSFIEQMVHQFEIRKRIYEYYDDDMKPTDLDKFYSTESYVAFAAILTIAITQQLQSKGQLNFKYLNTLIKLTDTILSFQSEISNVESELLRYILAQEKTLVNILLEAKGIKR